MKEGRLIYRYALYKVDPEWRRLRDEDRAQHKKELATLLKGIESVEVHPYSTVGLREDTDLLLWLIAEEVPALQSLQVAINGTALGRWLEQPYSYLALSRRSRYLKGHTHEEQEDAGGARPAGSRYLFVYPMDKQRPWYALPFDERRRMMAEHFKIGHRYPGVRIHTGYSFGVDDQEFVVAFEGESLGEFLDLVEELRGSAASAYTARDVPIFTCVRAPIERILDQIDGTVAGAS